MHNTENIINYLDGELNAKDKNEFNESLSSDKHLYEKYTIVSEIESCLKDNDTHLFRNLILSISKKFHKNQYQKELRRNRSFQSHEIHKLWKVAAVILVFAATIFTVNLLIQRNSNTSERIFDKYYEPYQKNLSNRSAGNHFTNLHLAFQAYKNKQYQEAITFFDKVLSMDSTVLFYKGIASIECGDYITALNSLVQLTGDSTNQYYIQSHWYIALTWLKLDQPENAVPHLTWLVKNNRYYGKKAASILKAISHSK